jgi:predicted metal-binding transcription factor (methanogenesis marker protein 9)
MSPARGKGTAFETLIVRYLQSKGWILAERRALHGNLDKGDITGTGPLVWECIIHKALDLSGWLRETEQERQNANANHGILVVKRRSYGEPGDQYAVMRLSDLVELLKEAGYGA